MDNPFAPSNPEIPQNQANSIPPNPFEGEMSQQPVPSFPDQSINIQNQSFGSTNTGFTTVQQPVNMGSEAILQNAGAQVMTPPVTHSTPAMPNNQMTFEPQISPQFTQPTPTFQQPQTQQQFVQMPLQQQYQPQQYQPQFNPQPQQQYYPQQQTPQTFGHQGESKYNIIDLYWFLNLKLKSNAQFLDGEVHMCTVGFNADYNNMRITFYNLNNYEDLKGPALIIGNMSKVSQFNIFSETASELLYLKNNNPQQDNITVRVYERMFKNSWNPNLSQIIWNKNNIFLQSQNNSNGIHSFTILDYQIKAFESALKFLVNGKSWLATLATN